MSGSAAGGDAHVERRSRLPRDLHPGAWWLWALGLAATATATTNPVLLLGVVAVACLTVGLRRSDHPWSGSFRLYLLFGLVIVVVRLVLRVLLGGGVGSTVLLDLPAVPLPGWVAGVTLLGPVTLESLLAGLYDGLRLAALVICVGAANALANPKRLLRSMPPALHEVGTAVVVAVALLPQLADSLRRVRAARALRGVPGGRVRRLRGVVVPVLEDALERSMALAAGMDARGYGRSGSLGRGRRATTGALLLLGLCGICVGSYAWLDQTAPRWLVVPGMLGGVALAALGLWSAGRRVQRTRYRPDRWHAEEAGVALAGLGSAVALRLLVDEPVLHPLVTGAPGISDAAVLAVLLGLAAAVVAPPPVLATDGERADRRTSPGRREAARAGAA
ncbi:energy-coupling factor transport system permease protein [Nocardioides scoriae]|uniref:Energy-coupling factor transport system permease protein n=1 Tax=Nocardioides scoriae TaxID=642780 RepID=A0A1H1Y876_9ACTN|nr:CbiQ family ECF transporter T component [Nocardioides scoriae]SDT17429.1 energy-coupling factor transport system permease protein [Nocardioides scoriae]